MSESEVIEIPQSRRLNCRILAIAVPMRDNPEYPGCNALKYTFSVAESWTQEQFREWFRKFIKSPIALKYKSHPELFQVKENHDWTRPTLRTVAGIKLEVKSLPPSI